MEKLSRASQKVKLSDRELDTLISRINFIAKHSGTKQDLAQAHNHTGYVYFFQKKYDKALDQYFAFLKIAEELKDSQNILFANHEVADTYFQLKNNTYSLKHLYYALDHLSNSTPLKYQSLLYFTFGGTYKNMNEFDSSLKYHMRALEIRKKMGDKKDLSASYNNIGLVYKRMKLYDKALESYNRSLALKTEMGDKKGQAGTLINMGNIYYDLKQYPQALKNFETGSALAYEVREGDFYLNGLDGLADTYFEMGKYKESAIYNKKHKLTYDSISDRSTNKQISDLTAQYETEKKNTEIALQQEQIRSKDVQNSKQKMVIIASVIALLMAFAAIFVVYRSYIQNKRNALQLAQKNHIIEEKNKEIMDSINYAKLIQQSLLASQEMLDKNLPKHFILYKPKDVVSGDFYWAAETPKGFLVACVDCTGHGVPGAFMSLIGKENLDKAISRTFDPGTILSELNQNVKRSLNQNSSSKNRDGMDLALIRIEYKTDQALISYAGANRPLMIHRKNSSSIEEIKATKNAIGGFTANDQKFEEHQLKLEKGDSIYICSDGYADQFGITNNKKLTTKKFKEILVSLGDMDSERKKLALEDHFMKWKGSLEQLDDLLVIGITI